MKKFTAEQILQAFKSKKYVVRDNLYQVNLFGIRNDNNESNTFDDIVGFIYRDEKNVWNIQQYKATTDPGLFYRLKPLNVNGTIIMVPTQHLNCYKIGLHRGYKAIQQIAPMSYVRDNNKNKILDFLYRVAGVKIIKEVAATNIHHASKTGESTNVDNWSAGCQVLANVFDFNAFISFIETSVNKHKNPNLFNYSLFELKDIK